jgi:two-component SAPR family response regulator
MLQARDAVLQHDGKLTLSKNVCWVDVWEFERSLNSGLDRGDSNGAANEFEAHLRAALGLYVGHFLALECEEPWMLEQRLRLKTKFERLVSSLSTYLEQQGRFAEAIDICLRALELDPLNELLYRRLMSCYLMRGELASVLGTYRRCCEALSKGLSASVSRETERLYVEALHASPQASCTPAIFRQK